MDRQRIYFRKAIDKAYSMELILPHKWQIANLQIKNICELAEKMQEDSFYLTNIANETDNGPKSPFFIKNEDLFDNFWQCVRREMIGLRNLAAASDLLRYAILYQEGGYYFDTDTKFHITPDTKFISEELLFDFKVQGYYVIEKQTSCTEGKRVYNILRQENLGNISFYGWNDLIAASPHHPSFIDCFSKIRFFVDPLSKPSMKRTKSGKYPPRMIYYK